MSEKAIQFLASFPPIQSAIKITGDGNGLRIQLDIPESEMADAAYLIAMRNTILRVTIEPYEQETRQEPEREPRTIKRTTAKKRD